MISRKLWPLSLCFIMAFSFVQMIPIIPTPPPFPPSPIIPPGTPILPPIPEEYVITVWINVLVAGDEEFDSTIYETPNGGLEGKRYAELQIRLATIPFARDFGIELIPREYTMWDSDDSLTGVALYNEVLAETGFYSGMYVGQSYVDILIAFTGQDLTWAGWANWIYDAAIIMPQAYWADHQVIQHEVSHLFKCADGTYESYVASENECYMKECVMSKRQIWVDTVTEDSTVYEVHNWVNQGYLTDKWCNNCTAVIESNKGRYVWYLQEPYGDDC